jgi:hypothetical protein
MAIATELVCGDDGGFLVDVHPTARPEFRQSRIELDALDDVAEELHPNGLLRGRLELEGVAADAETEQLIAVSLRWYWRSTRWRGPHRGGTDRRPAAGRSRRVDRARRP